MKHYFDGILRRNSRPEILSKKFFIKSPYPYLSNSTDLRKFLSENFEVAKSFPSREKQIKICQNAPKSTAQGLDFPEIARARFKIANLT